MNPISLFIIRLGEIPMGYLRVNLKGVLDCRVSGEGVPSAIALQPNENVDDCIVEITNSDNRMIFHCADEYAQVLFNSGTDLHDVPLQLLNDNRLRFMDELIEIVKSYPAGTKPPIKAQSNLISLMRRYILRAHLDSYLNELYHILAQMEPAPDWSYPDRSRAFQ